MTGTRPNKDTPTFARNIVKREIIKLGLVIKNIKNNHFYCLFLNHVYVYRLESLCRGSSYGYPQRMTSRRRAGNIERKTLSYIWPTFTVNIMMIPLQ